MKKAFTLSEVLITLSIIGIVATLTIPSLMKNFHNRLYVAQLQKVVSQIESATHTIMNDEHVDNFYETKVTLSEIDTGQKDAENHAVKISGAEYFLTKYFKTSKTDCGPKSDDDGNSTDVAQNCFALGSNGFMQGNDAYHSIGGAALTGIQRADYCIQTTNNAAICMIGRSLLIDINGPADPNVSGRDAFIVNINNDGTLSDIPNCSCNQECNTVENNFGKYAAGCYKEVVDAGWKIEY